MSDKADDVLKRVMSDPRGRRALEAALKRKAEIGMLPLMGNITPELLDGFNDEFVGWMIDTITTEDVSEPSAVRQAISESVGFKATMNASIDALRKSGPVIGYEEAAQSLIVVCLLAGWKLCERKLEQLAEGVAG
jgi:hypothetical protein